MRAIQVPPLPVYTDVTIELTAEEASDLKAVLGRLNDSSSGQTLYKLYGELAGLDLPRPEAVLDPYSGTPRVKDNK